VVEGKLDSCCDGAKAWKTHAGDAGVGRTPATAAIAARRAHTDSATNLDDDPVVKRVRPGCKKSVRLRGGVGHEGRWL